LESQIDDITIKVQKTTQLYEQFKADFPEVYTQETAAQRDTRLKKE
jgi:hypothetical protein